jgi:uncharacterized protein (TIGR02001 family)
MFPKTKAWIPVVMIALAGIHAPAVAGIRRPFKAEVALATDYIFRGYSRSDSAPVLQAGLRYRHDAGFSAGLWGSTVDFPAVTGADDERGGELRAFAGFGRPIGQNWSWSLFVVHSEFFGVDPRFDNSYTEADASAQFRDLFTVTVAYTDDYLGSDISGLFVELSGSYPLPRNFHLAAGIGWAELDLSVIDYVYGHLAAGWSMGRFSLELGYYDSDARPIRSWGEVADETLVLSVSTRFP